MARRARMGRRPRTQQNVTGVLISIAREMQSKRDQNIMEAWKDGGEFEGSKVTDQEVEAYWKGRLKGLSKQDPSYDEVRTQIMQLQYGIAQSKMDLKYVQGKITDQEYAKFFLSWAAKVPKNGEWWRVLQKDAARLMEASKERARINGEKAKQERFNRFVESKNEDIAVGNAITEAINRLSQETGLSVTGNGDRLLELLGEDYAENPGRYHALTDAMKTADTSFTGTFSHSFVAGQIGNAEEAYDDIAVRARKEGYATAYDSATKGQAAMATWGSNMEVWSVAQGYDKAWASFSRVWNDPTASYRDKQSSATAFAEATTKLALTPNIDQATQQMLNADAARAMGQDAGDTPSFGMAQLGREGFTPQMQAQVATTQAAQQMMDENPGVYTYAPMNQDGTFDPTGQAPVGIVAVSAVPPDAILIAQPGLNGQPSMVAIQPHTVYVKDPNDPNAAPVAVGRTIEYQVGGQTITMYGYQDGQGNAQWTLRSPYADGVSGQKDKEGNLILSFGTASSPAATAAAIDAKYGTNIASQIEGMGPAGGKTSAVAYQRDASGNITGRLNVEFDGSGFSVKQTQYTRDADGKQVEGATTTVPVGINRPEDLATAALAPSRMSGENVAGTYTSPLATSVAATAQTMSSAQVAALSQDPAFQHAFVTQTMQNYGTNDPMDPRVISAWNKVTSKANQGWQMHDEAVRRMGAYAPERADLNYPGMNRQDPTKTTGVITFGGKDIKVPGLPAYMNQGGKPPMVNLNGVSDFLKTQGQFGQSVLQFGQMIGQAAAQQGATAPTKTASPSYSVSTKASPTTSPTPTATVATVATPAPTPPPPPPPSAVLENTKHR